MSNTKSSSAKSNSHFRCSDELKQQILETARSHNTTESIFCRSAVETAIKYQNTSYTDNQTAYLYNLKCNILKNKVWNLINLDPNIPKHTKDKIRKELDNHVLC